jgi:uncharacterized protein
MIDLAPQHIETVKRILAEHVPDCEVRVFGSRVGLTAKDYSDLDLAVVGAQSLDTDVMRHLNEAFQESDLPIRVDVLDWYAIAESFHKVIQAQYEVLQHKDVLSTSPAKGDEIALTPIPAIDHLCGTLKDDPSLSAELRMEREHDSGHE